MANERYGEFLEDTPRTFAQGLFEESATQKHPLGTIRRLSDGREFIYCQMGGAAGVAGSLYQSIAADVANSGNLAVTAAANIGSRSISFTLGNSGLMATANSCSEGFAHINVGASNGMAYKIKSHAAIVANAGGTVVLYDKVRNANIATATSKVTITPNRCKSVILTTGSNNTGTLVGVAIVPSTAAYYVWLQKRGECAVEVDGTVVVGGAVFPAANDGTVGPGANGTTEAFFPVGICMVPNANDTWALIDLRL
jgi:hypothetical protein